MTRYLNRVVVHHKFHVSDFVNTSFISNEKMFKCGAAGLNQVGLGFIWCSWMVVAR